MPTSAELKQSEYLNFGSSSVPAGIAIKETLAYLSSNGFDNNYLQAARQGVQDFSAEFSQNSYDGSDMPETMRCSFCGKVINGIEFEALADGRKRCNSCSHSILATEAQFIQLFKTTKLNYEATFNVALPTNVNISMVNAQDMSKRVHRKHLDGAAISSRALGYSLDNKNSYDLVIENSSPRISALLTLVHELTHVWQFANYGSKQMSKMYGSKTHNLQAFEGMAVWAQLQYLYNIREIASANHLLELSLLRTDEYGAGLRLYLERYSLDKSGKRLNFDTPFRHERPL